MRPLKGARSTRPSIPSFEGTVEGRPLLGIVGPTGIGKSEVALAIARSISVEIVVVDSMQVYRGMEIGTGKPDAEIRREIPHHGLDLVEPEEEFNVAQYRRMTAPVIDEILARGKTPLLVGGSGLYLKGLLDGLCEAPGEDPVIRKELWEEADRKGAADLHTELQRVDPESAARIHPNDVKKMIRALEVFRISGRPISVWQRQTTQPFEKAQEVTLFGLTCDRGSLYARVEARIDRWLESGWLQEAKQLHRRPLSRTARKALGYRELFEFLEGRADWETTVSSIKRNSRQYTKRQWTWFKADPRIRWVDRDGKSPDEAATQILKDTPVIPAKAGNPRVREDPRFREDDLKGV